MQSERVLTVLGATHVGHSVTNHVQKGFRTYLLRIDLYEKTPSFRPLFPLRASIYPYLSTAEYLYFLKFSSFSSAMKAPILRRRACVTTENSRC